jgi:hypothetical protein
MKARQFSYTAYGLGIRSSLALPELEAGDGTADAVVRRGKLAARPAPATGLEMSAHVTAERARFSWPDVGTFLVADGTRIIADAAPCVPESVLRLYVLGPALATLLRQRGLLVLHASAVSIAGEAVAFLGGPGWGKSTAAAALHARGHAVVADDVIAVAPAAGGPVVLPGFPWLKLWPDVSRAIGEVPERLPRVHPGLEKRELRVPRGFWQAPLPLRCLYVLGEGETLEAEPLTRQQALVELLRHSYGARALHGVKTDSHFRQSAAVAGRVPVRRLRNRRSLATLTDVARLIEGDLAQPVR